MDVRYDARNDCLERIRSAKSVIKYIIYNGLVDKSEQGNMFDAVEHLKQAFALVKESKSIFCSDDDIEWNERNGRGL